MLVVPIQKDTILTKDGAKLRVVEYTNFKDGGPAVYAKSASKEMVLVYFFDIAEINGTKVEYERGAKLFRALGKIARAQHLPQPDDTIVVLNDTVSGDDDAVEKSRKEVTGLKLKSKSLGINKGMFVKCDDGNTFRLKTILTIERALGSSNFSRDEFHSLYKDYMGV